MTPDAYIDEHQAAGRRLRVGEWETFVREAGSGPSVLCVHGVPVSSLIYRHLLPELAQRGLRAVCYDHLGCGLADRPETVDYSWTGLGRFAVETVNALGLERFHLVTHDVGGPISFELLAAMPERIASVTLLNTIMDVEGFVKPWPMRPLGHKLSGRPWLSAMVGPVYTQTMYLVGVANKAVCPPNELLAHLRLLKRDDNGRAFLRIMQSFEPTAEKAQLYHETLSQLACPKQAIWGIDDPALTLARHGERARQLVGASQFHELRGKHFIQVDAAPAIADHVAQLVAHAGA